MEDFFGYSIDLNNRFPFINSEQDNTQTLANEWQYCLQLKEKETRNFYFQAITTDGTPVLFNFNAVGLNLPVHIDSPAILFAVKKNPAKNSLSLQNKTAVNYQKDYAEFIDIASHDLDAPLRKLSLLIERLAHKHKTEPGGDMQVYFSRIQTSLTDMRSLVDSLSRLSGLSSKPMVNVSCDIVKIINETLNSLRQQVPDKKISETIPASLVLEGDITQYRQLFQNLLQNAIRFSKKDLPLQISISSTSVSPLEKQSLGLQGDKNWTRIAVMDNGIGFRQEYAEKIFKPFVRLHGKSEYPGSDGIGLAICKKVVENHGGIIYSEGKENTGATFTLILPQSL
jgi:signal transduction histidine kinase